MAEARPIRLLIAALGGEGGGVLASWLHTAAIGAGHFVQGTYIPGVAQRTGATTYYLELVPGAGARHAESAGRPVLALNAAPGEVDVMVASELLESTRAIQAGYVSPERTILIASKARIFTIDEKTAMGDGRLDETRMLSIADRFARRTVIADFAAVAAEAQSPLNAVLLGAIAATGALPIPADAFRAAIRAEGKAVDANIRGFEAGLAAKTATPVSAASRAGKNSAEPRLFASSALRVEGGALKGSDPLDAFPDEAREVLATAIERLTDYQDRAYAWRYLARVNRFVGSNGADGPFIRELARHLAVRMTVEDVIRVAQLKLRDARLERVTQEARARPGDIVDVTEYMKPGPEEILGLLPPRLGRWALTQVAARGGSRWSWPLKIRTTRLSGFLRLRAVAALRRWRPRTLRFAEEQAWVERWLGLVERTLAADPAAAREVVATAALVRGYADTYKRGLANWTRIMDEIVEPMLMGRLPRAHFADAVLQARIAANKDPDGEALAATIAAIRRAGLPGKLAAE
jgi:indolepyruvate ferredoxin oxidoreductase, beta subunit